MYKTVSGTCKGGIVQLGESIPGLLDGPVLVTFLDTTSEQPAAPNLTSSQIAELRGKLAAWEEDWNAPGMELYDKP